VLCPVLQTRRASNLRPTRTFRTVSEGDSRKVGFRHRAFSETHRTLRQVAAYNEDNANRLRWLPASSQRYGDVDYAAFDIQFLDVSPNIQKEAFSRLGKRLNRS